MSGGVGAMISPRRASRHNSIGGGSYQQQLQHVRNIINDGTESSGPSQKGIIKENNIFLYSLSYHIILIKFGIHHKVVTNPLWNVLD